MGPVSVSKTPTAIALIQRLSAQGIAAHIVSRGYGGTEVGPLRIAYALPLRKQDGDDTETIQFSFGPQF